MPLAGAAVAAHVAHSSVQWNPHGPAGLKDGAENPQDHMMKIEDPEPDPERLACYWFWRYQRRARHNYNLFTVQIGVAVLIAGNFLMNAIQKQIDPAEDKHTQLFESIELFFNIAFTIELAWNMYGNWFKDFWKSGWNIFDFLVVVIGLLTTFQVPLPGPFSMLRMMRAFRVFRLFKRVKSLKKIMESLAKAVPGMRDAFIILLLVMCIYAILAVEFFQDFGEGFEMENENGTAVPLRTPRGQTFGYEYFGNFMKALYTMFQVLTGDSWSEVIARPLVHGPEPAAGVAYASFFVSFIIVNAIVLINIVVAVLLEKMVDPEASQPPPNVHSTNSVVSSNSVQVADSFRPASQASKRGSMQSIPSAASGSTDLHQLRGFAREMGLSDDVASLKAEVTELKGKVVEIIDAMQKAGLQVQPIAADKNLR